MKSNSIARSSFLVMSLVLTVAGAHAQSTGRTYVPFAFKVGTTQMPAGTYAVQNDAGSDIVTVRNVETRASALVMGRRESPTKKTDKLVFHRYGSQYFLTAVLGEKGSQGMVLPATKQEKNFQIAHVPANRGNNIEIASK